MESRRFTVPEMCRIGISVSHVDIDAESPLNHNESHIHKECEIYLNLSGDVSFEVENRIYPISRGSAIITRPYEYHHCIYRSNRRHEHYWITFSVEKSEDFLKMFFGREKGRDNLIQLTPTQLEALLAVLERLLDNKIDPLQLRIDCLQLFAILYAGRREKPAGCLEDLPRDVADALRFMDGHLAEDVDIEMIASSGNVSVNTLERHFKAALGVSPSVMLRKKRLIASMEHLRSGESVTEAALRSGFPDYSNYIQLFRKQFGLTPLQYKKKFSAE